MGWHVRQVAGDPLAAPLLLAMELDEWSMDSASVARQKFALSSLTAGESWKLLTQVLDMDTAKKSVHRLKLLINTDIIRFSR